MTHVERKIEKVNDYLFSQSFLIVPSVITSLLCFLFLLDYRRFLKHKQRLVQLFAVAAALFLAEILAVQWTVGFSNTPAAAYYMTLAFDVVIVATILYIRAGRPHKLLGIGAAVSLLVLIVLTVNNFYQYYPTLSSLMGHPNTSAQQLVTTTRITGKVAAAEPIETRLLGHGFSQGVVATVNIPGTVSGLNARDGYVYTPPAYNNSLFASTKFPVLVLLTGTPGNPSSWLQNGLFLNTMNDFASHHSGITPIVAIVDHSGSFLNDTECLDSIHGNAETYLTVDVVNYLKTNYRVSNNPDQWGIGGFSEGGMCAAMLTLTHQDVFRHFLDESGDPYPYLDDQSQTLPVLFNGSRTALQHHNIDWLISNQPLNSDVTGQFAIGGSDSNHLVSEMRYSYKLATKRHLTSSLEVIQNQGHTFGFWSHAYSDALPTLSYYLGATECQTSCAGQ